jgi:predicted RNA-binding protein with PIN domain
MFYLIDGYNLLHAMGILGGAVGPAGLERARLNLLGVLRGAHGPEAEKVTVVFDAADPPRGLPARFDYQGLHVAFAVDQEQADDLIEELIRQEAAPKNLTVVSDDRRVQQAARRRNCVAQGCEEYLRSLQTKRLANRPKTDSASLKPHAVSDAETRHWLDEFADLAEDPGLKELFGPAEFLEKEGEQG